MSPITQSDLLLRAAGDSFLGDPVGSGLVLVGSEFVSHGVPIVLLPSIMKKGRYAASMTAVQPNK